MGLVQGPFKAGKSLFGKPSEELASALASARKRGDELIARATTDAEKASAKATKERLISETMIGRQETKVGKVPQETAELEKLARAEAQIPAAHGVSEMQAKTDLESQLRQLGQAKLAAAEEKQAKIGGKAFSDYERIAREKEKTVPLAKSPEGEALRDELTRRIEGGLDAQGLRTVDETQASILKQIRNEIFGAPPKQPSVAEIAAEAQKLPKSMSQVARERLAKEALLKKQGEGKPYNAKLVDDKLRELRQTEQSKLPEAGTLVARGRYGSSADLIENALKKWVGEGNYPRATYAEASKELNEFRTKLGEALTAREAIPYGDKTGMLEKQGPVSKLVFGSRDSVKYARQILGDAEVNTMAKQHAANQLEGKTAEQARDWLKKSEFVYETPGLKEQVEGYIKALEKNERNAAVSKTLREQYGTAKETARKTEAATLKEVQGLKDTLQDLRIKILDATPTQLQNEWSKTDGLRARLEKTGKFTGPELDAIAQDLAAVTKAAGKLEKSEQYKALLKKIAVKAGIPAGIIGIGGAGYKAFSGD
jgi:hypothetical protein